jgi:hypothetical protein
MAPFFKKTIQNEIFLNSARLSSQSGHSPKTDFWLRLCALQFLVLRQPPRTTSHVQFALRRALVTSYDDHILTIIMSKY